ncbi:MAG: hypothetical protein JWM95_2987 [Gemmatimonadetes bacterium]|nr:hypothetical protein [Gemmatimonadota bacterium]
MITLTLAGIFIMGLVAHFSGRSPGGHGLLGRVLNGRAVIVMVFTATFVVLWYSWASLDPIPVVQDEMSYVLQAQIFARGMWSLPASPMPLFWEQLHVLVEPRVASKYFPGHALLMAPGAVLGWPALMPLVLQSISGALLFVLARRVANGGVAIVAWTIWLFSPMVLYFGPSYFSEATTTTCWLAGWYALLEWRTNREARWLMAVAFFVGWDAITRPLTGLAYAIPVAIVVMSDVVRLGKWKDLAYATLAGMLVLAILPVWSAHTTGHWTDTPLALYTRMYMPYDVPGFGLKTALPTHYVTPELAQWNMVYMSAHVKHLPQRLLTLLGERSLYLWISSWGISAGILGLFAVIGLATLNRTTAFALASSVFLLITYLSFGTPAAWTLYYYESVPTYMFLAASGLAWVSSLIGRPQGTPPSSTFDWRSPRWTRALVVVGLILAYPGIAAMRLIHAQHIDDRKHLMPFYRLLASIHDPRAVVFVRYSAMHDPHVTFVRNTANPDAERVWVVYDRGDVENARFLASVPERKAYLFDETQGRTFQYDPRAIE